MSEEIKRLMAIASKPLRKPLKKMEYASNVFQFISEYDIRSSEADHISFPIIYFKYYRWAEAVGLDPVASSIFSRDFAKKFDKSLRQNKVHFKISPAGFDLSPSNQQDAEDFLEEITNRAKQKKENKKAVKEKLKKGSGKPGPSKSDKES